jgi:hypothetical protein
MTALVAPQPGEAYCGAQFPELGALLLLDRQRTWAAGLGNSGGDSVISDCCCSCYQRRPHNDPVDDKENLSGLCRPEASGPAQRQSRKAR